VKEELPYIREEARKEAEAKREELRKSFGQQKLLRNRFPPPLLL